MAVNEDFRSAAFGHGGADCDRVRCRCRGRDQLEFAAMSSSPLSSSWWEAGADRESGVGWGRRGFRRYFEEKGQKTRNERAVAVESSVMPGVDLTRRAVG